MLDMSVRAKILELMLALKNDFDLTYLYVTHDLATAKFFCDRIAIMYLGRIVEIGTSEAIYADPKHPYTRALLRAIPEPDPRGRCRATCRGARCPDAARRRSAARSIRAARSRSSHAAGSREICASCSSLAGHGEPASRASRRRPR
jgi:ABC-type oligopeptide transport system ATPase subunit